MCVIIKKPEDVTIEKEELQKCFRKNKDGCGFAVVLEDGVYISSGYTDFDKFYEEYIKLTNDQKKSSLIHFRLKTIGEVNTNNCHPFYMGDVAFAHNGTIRDAPIIGDMSDSATLAYVVDSLCNRKKDPLWATTEEGVKFVKDYLKISIGNKGAILTPDNKFILFNEALWDESGGCMYSNLRHRFPKNEYGQSFNRIGQKSIGRINENNSSNNNSNSNSSHSMICKGKGCTSILKRKVDVEVGYCVHCCVKLQSSYMNWEEHEEMWRNRPIISE